MDFLEKSAKSTVEFAQDQVPLVAKEIVSWYFWENAIFATMYLFILVFLFIFMLFVLKKIKEYWDTADEVKVFGTVGLFVMMLISCGLLHSIIFYTSNAVKAQVTPRLVLIDYIKNVVKPNQQNR